MGDTDPRGIIMTDELSDLLVRARLTIDHDVVRDESVALARCIVAADVPTVRRSRRSRRGVGVAVGLMALAGTATVAAGVAVTHTGWFGDPSRNTEDPDTSEWLDLGATDFPAVAHTLIPTEVPLPSGQSWNEVADSEIAEMQANPGLMQEIGVRAKFLFAAECSWQSYWADAQSSGDSAAAAHALDVLDETAHHTIWSAVDGGGIVQLRLDNLAAARQGDPAPLMAYFDSSCGDEQ
jgi:hypothetical protein